MSLPGWYPDPAGAPNRFRYWDGHAWSSDTTDNPASAPGGAAGQGGSAAAPGGPGAPSADRARRRFGPLILALVALVVLVLVGVFVVRGLFADRPIVDPGPLPSSTVSGWDDSSPTTPPETPTPTPSVSPPPPTPTPTPTPSEEQPLQPCPEGDPAARQDHPSDGRIHGGGLSFSKISGWKGLSTPSEYSWAYDVAGQQKQLEPNWIASATVGALFTGAGFDETRRSAELVMQCVITSGFYTDTAERTDLWSKAITVDGHPAWSIRAEVRIDVPDVRADGDTVDVIIVDTGSPESLAMFVGAASLGDDDVLAAMDSTIENLLVE